MENLQGKQVTVFWVAPWTAMTSVARGAIVEQTWDAIRVHVPKPRRRKPGIVTVELDRKTLVFEGDAPFLADVESTGTWSGNACLNFVGEIQDVRHWIETKNLNEQFDRHDSVMMSSTPNGEFDCQVEPVFPETETAAALVQQYRAERLVAE